MITAPFGGKIRSLESRKSSCSHQTTFKWLHFDNKVIILELDGIDRLVTANTEQPCKYLGVMLRAVLTVSYVYLFDPTFCNFLDG